MTRLLAHVIRRYSKMSTIIKSPEDNRIYKGLLLPNDLKVLLISDPQTDKSSACLDVFVGHLSDPFPGLAHFTEHMLFLGTKKYPGENDYTKFLSQHGGSSNAYTLNDHTNFHFDVSPKYFLGEGNALDRFAQFFLAPLFTESASDREVRAVNSEHEKNIPSDMWRINQLDKSLCDPTHDYSKFGTGNIETLDIIPKSKGIKVRNELLAFHSKWYSSNIMSLVLLGNESIEELESAALEYFSSVSNKNVKVPEWKTHPYHSENNQSVCYIVPITDIRSLCLTFAIPDLQIHYRTGPVHYLAHLIGHEGKGSLLSELRARGWISTLGGGEKVGGKGFSFFVINVDLTEVGIQKIDSIISLMFQYLNLLRFHGPQKYVFDECKNVKAMLFRFKDKEKPLCLTTSLAHLLHIYPMEEVLIGPYIMDEWKPSLIEETLEYLKPKNCRISIIGQKYSDDATLIEPYYGTKYCVQKIEDSKVENWLSGATDSSHMALPEKNEFIPTNFEIYPLSDDLKNEKFPVILKESPILRLWFKQDDEFCRPKANLYFEFKTPLVYQDPNSVNCTCVYMLLFKDELTEYTYDAELAGLSYSINNSKFGIILNIRGYNEKQELLLDKILSKLKDFHFTAERFKIMKEAHTRSIKNFEMDEPQTLGIYNNNVLLSERHWHREDLISAMEELTIESLRDFINRIWTHVHIEMLFHGNISKEQAMSISDAIQNKYFASSKALQPCQLIKEREICLENKTHSVYKTTTIHHKSSSIETYFQCGLQNAKSNVLLELFSQIINEPCFNVLRTKEQLGYIVYSGTRRASGVQGLRVIVQSDRHPQYLDSRIESFLFSMKDYIQNMSSEEFLQNKQALSDKRLEKPKKLFSLTVKYWYEILTQEYNYDRDAIEVQELNNVTKEDILHLYEQYFSFDAPLRKKLACHVISLAEGGAGLQTEPNMKCPLDDAILPPSPMSEICFINDRNEFKRQLGLYPLVKRAVDLTTVRR